MTENTRGKLSPQAVAMSVSPPPAHKARKLELKLELELLDDQAPPHLPDALDHSSWGFRVAYATFFFTGSAMVAMWSSIMLCLDFFDLKYPTERVGFVLPVINMSTLLVVCLYMLVAGRQLPLEPRVHGSSVTYLLFVVLLPVANIVPMHTPIAYGLTVLSVVGSTISSSVLQSTMYGLGGVFGPYFIQALDGGKGLGAMLLFVTRLLTKWWFQLPTNPHLLTDPAEIARFHVHAEAAMAVFFAVTFFLVALAWVLYICMRNTAYAQPLLQEYLLVQHDTPYAAGSPMHSPMVTPSPTRRSFSVSERSPLLPHHSIDDLTPTPNGSTSPVRVAPPLSPDATLREAHASSASIPSVLRTAAKPFFSLFFSYFLCLSCFPGIITAIQSTTFQLGDWFPIVMVGCYNFGDLIGKNLPVYVLYFDVETLHLPWILQVACVPLFMLEMLHPFADIVTIVLVTLFGFLTGYVTTSSMILAPSICSEYQKEVAGMVGSLCAIIGLCVGSYNGLALETLLELLRDRQ
ncbi:TPA: hypothetical protein N0F65_004065 [Lagenidium giganteum]|uniref:Uncharacterized protein n=1 Tax=Lagenidium giganteum TaxID=4803 RepID=A0AAV2Z241_9STRA|nr:TPA: hypothetical protein N0F65_004065 [Lagenidium giganteum]